MARSQWLLGCLAALTISCGKGDDDAKKWQDLIGSGGSTSGSTSGNTAKETSNDGDGNSDEAIAAAVLKQLQARFSATKPYRVYFEDEWSYRRAKQTGVIVGRYRDARVEERAPKLKRCQLLAVDISQQVDDKGKYYKLSTGAVGVVKTIKCPPE